MVGLFYPLEAGQRFSLPLGNVWGSVPFQRMSGQSATSLSPRVPNGNYLRDSKFLLKIRTSEREEAGEIMLSNSDFYR